MQFMKVFSILALGATAVHASPAAGNFDAVAARTPAHALTVNTDASVTLNVTGVGEALATILHALGVGGNVVDGLLTNLLKGGSNAINETADGIAHVLGETPALAQALSNLLGTIDVCVD